jgi:predicted ester cyclase
MTTKTDLEQVVRRSLDELWSRGKLDVADAIYTNDFTNHDPNQPELPPGPAGMKQQVTMWRSVFPDLSFHIDDIFTAEDRVVTRFTGSGTHKGELPGVAPTGRRCTGTALAVSRVDNNGRIAETWMEWDALGLFQQMGASLEAATQLRVRRR